MRRVASLWLPQLPIERLRRSDRPNARPEPTPIPKAPIDDDPGACTVPRDGGWRPGARWAQDAPRTQADVAAEIATLPAHRRPPARELGRRSEAAEHPFHRTRSDDAGAAAPRLIASSYIQSHSPAYAPLVLEATVARRQIIVAACPAALALGLEPGLALTHASALVTDLDVRPSDTAADEALLQRLALHASRHWTPMTSATLDGLWLDLTGTTHLFGGEERFCRQVVRFMQRLRFTGRIAIADTAGAAHALARFGNDSVIITAQGHAVQAIAPLPVDALRLDGQALAACRRFGIERIADLLPMPRGPLARRLGRAAITRLDQAIGRVAEPIEPVLMPDVPVADRRLLEPVGTPEAIAQLISDLVVDLVECLRERGVGARSVVFVVQRVDGTDQRIVIGTAKATRDAVHLTRLLHLRMETIDPGMGIEVATLSATRTDPLGATAFAAMLAGDRTVPEIAPLVDQLAGRVGGNAMFRATIVESDVPERAVARIGALEEPRGWPSWRRPVRLLHRPESLSNVIALLPDHPPRRFSWRGSTHVVVAGDGPERIHGEWWVRDGEVWAVRDYYRVEDAHGGRYWVFRRGDGVQATTGDLTWWMHGAFG